MIGLAGSGRTPCPDGPKTAASIAVTIGFGLNDRLAGPDSAPDAKEFQ